MRSRHLALLPACTAQCYVFVAHMGLLSGGGVGEFLSTDERMIVDIDQVGAAVRTRVVKL